MAHMPFKMSYNFEGECRRRPEQDLSGASKNESRETLLQRAHQERQKRQEQRLKLKSTLILQSYIRSYLVRKHKKQEKRLNFHLNENVLNIKPLLGKLLFFYDSKIDHDCLVRTCQRLLDQHLLILQQIDFDNDLNWCIRRILALSINEINNNQSSELLLKVLDTLTENTHSRVKIEIWPYLIKKGYFAKLRQLLDSDYQPIDTILKLIHRPLIYNNSLPQARHSEEIWSQFCHHFLCSTVTPQIKNILLPFLSSVNFPYSDFVKFLHESQSYTAGNSLLYSFLVLESSNFEPSKENIQVLSLLSVNLHQLTPPKNHDDADSDDDEIMEISDEIITIQEYIHLLNNSDTVKKINLYFEEHKDDEELLIYLLNLCQNLLLFSKDSIKKFALVFMLALKGTFLSIVWQWIKKNRSLIYQPNTGFLDLWKDVHTAISVFCSMFVVYSDTLLDTDSIQSIFDATDLCSLAEMLKNMSINLIEMAYPLCRSHGNVTPELLHLYYACINSVQKLYMLDLNMKFCKTDFWTKRKIHVAADLGRKNYLSITLKPFRGFVTDKEDDHQPPLLTIEQRSLAILQQLPFLLEFNSRVVLLSYLCHYSLGDDSSRLVQEFMSDAPIVIRRAYLYEDAFEKLPRENESDMRHIIRIQFINDVGLEEAGIDGGGIFKEFINEVLKTAFDPNRGFFLLTDDNTLYPNPNVHLLVENFAEHYYFIGRLVGKAIFEHILVDLPLAEFFLAKILVDKASAHYLKSLDIVLYKNLLYLRDFSGDVQDLGLDFTIINNDLGEVRLFELKPNGRNIAVTNHNRLEYIHLLADYKLNTQIKKQCAAFRAGLESVIPLLWLKLFDPFELQTIISGNNQEIDVNDLRAHTSYGGDFTADHPTILAFWRILHGFSDLQKRMLLKFVTSCSRPPLLGFEELNPQFCIQSAGTEDRMPTASTCLNLLKLPIIYEEEVLKNKILAAIEQQAGFELS